MKSRDRTEAEQISFFRQCLAKFEEAEARAGSVRRCYQVAGTSVCLRFAGEQLVPMLTAALAHLGTAECLSPEVTLCIWDSQSTGVPMVAPPCDNTCFTDRGDIWGFNSRRIKTAFHWIENSVNVMDLERKVGVFWVQTMRTVPFWVYASPLRTLFHWWMEENGCQLLHAAAVGTPHGAVMISGRGGVGKSTTALACLQAGFDYVADDYLIVSHDPHPMVHSLYSTAKLNAGDVAAFSRFRSFISNYGKLDHEKAVMFLHPHFKEQLKRSMPVKALFTPSVADQDETTIARTPYWTIQRAIAFTTMSQLPGVGRRTHDFINAFCGKLPSYQLTLGRVREQIPEAISRFLESPPTIRDEGPIAVSAAERKPLVTVIIPVFNGERFIAEALQNIQSQGYPALEIIVVDDGSKDKTAAIVQQFESDIRYFRQDNSGPASARNRGLRDASGEFILFLDVDDLWPENNINLLVEHMLREKDTDIVRGYAQLAAKDERSGEMKFTGNPKDSFADYIGAAIYRKSVFSRVGLFDPALLFGEDSDWFVRARESKVKIKQLEEITLFVRRHGANMTEGKNLVELNLLHVFKKALDRRRAVQNRKPE